MSIPQNELQQYIQQLALPGIAGGEPVTPPLHFPNDKTVFSHLDWLRVRYSPVVKESQAQFYSTPINHDWFMEDTPTRGLYGYTKGVTLKPCGTFYWDGSQDNMGSVIDLTGLDLARLRYEHQVSDDEILTAVMRRAVKATRVDFCVNINDGTPASARDEWQAGRLKTRVRKGIYYEPMGEAKGDSLYIGSQGSAKYVRVYDKARELKLLNAVLTRIEMQATKKSAPILAKSMLLNGVKEAGKKAILQHADFPGLAWYQDALSGAMDASVQLTPREKGDTVRWLREHVGPAIEKKVNAGYHIPEITEWLIEMENVITRAKKNLRANHMSGDDD